SFAISVLNSFVTHGVLARASVDDSVATPRETRMAVMEAKIPNLAMSVGPYVELGRLRLSIIHRATSRDVSAIRCMHRCFPATGCSGETPGPRPPRPERY